jgi:hypothetical protein
VSSPKITLPPFNLAFSHSIKILSSVPFSQTKLLKKPGAILVKIQLKETSFHFSEWVEMSSQLDFCTGFTFFASTDAHTVSNTSIKNKNLLIVKSRSLYAITHRLYNKSSVSLPALKSLKNGASLLHTPMRFTTNPNMIRKSLRL